MNNLQRIVMKYLKERGWDHLRPSDVAKSIMIEGAELLELFQWENLDLEEIKKDSEKLEEIKKELADVFIYALEMAALLGLDTEAIIKHKLTHAAKKYPAALMRKSAKGSPGSRVDTEYLRIKKEYRKKRI